MNSDFPQPLTVVETADGSQTLFDPARQLHYRSIHGARRESRHVFLDATRLTSRRTEWTVLELGFGAAVNFCETARAAAAAHVALHYHAVDYRPVLPDDIDFHTDFAGQLARAALSRWHTTRDTPVRVGAEHAPIQLTLHVLPWLQLERPGLGAHAVFYDPFGPRAEPASWQPRCFSVARDHMADDAVLATYSAATRVKRAMAAAGLHVGRLPGPGRKREMTVAARTLGALDHAEWLDL